MTTMGRTYYLNFGYRVYNQKTALSFHLLLERTVAHLMSAARERLHVKSKNLGETALQVAIPDESASPVHFGLFLLNPLPLYLPTFLLALSGKFYLI
jgi:hypothetical protein